MRSLTAYLLAASVLAGCSQEAGPASDFIPVGDVAELMGHIVDPAAGVYWDAVGTIVDADGVHEITPQSDEEWELVSNAAFTIAEAGNLLMMEGRRVDGGAWITLSQQLVDAGGARSRPRTRATVMPSSTWAPRSTTCATTATRRTRSRRCVRPTRASTDPWA